MSVRLPDTEHISRPWRIHEIAPDFRVEDVWAFPDSRRRAGRLPRHARGTACGRRARPEPTPGPIPVRSAVEAGRLLGWDDPDERVGARVPSLRDRLPPGLRETSAGEEVPNTPFSTVCELHDEAAYELANKTVHDVLHLGWVGSDSGDHELRMAALVKPNGVFGRLYMAGITPFRYLIVYPALTRQWERAWRERDTAGRQPGDGGPQACGQPEQRMRPPPPAPW